MLLDRSSRRFRGAPTTRAPNRSSANGRSAWPRSEAKHLVLYECSVQQLMTPRWAIDRQLSSSSVIVKELLPNFYSKLGHIRPIMSTAEKVMGVPPPRFDQRLHTQVTDAAPVRIGGKVMFKRHLLVDYELPWIMKIATFTRKNLGAIPVG